MAKLYHGSTLLIEDFKDNITNCITEIPQDIKLELNNGTLTLKAGSKVYVPNGSGIFDTVTISSDLTATYSDTSDIKCFLFYVNGTLNLGNISVSVSGTTPPTTGFFYNTSTNKISFYLDGNMVWDNGSFPLCIASCSNNSVNSIDQVFNSFGYIGSTVFALPGVKGLAPNGRNEDGTLKNIEYTNTNVQTLTISSDWGTGTEQFFINGINLDVHRACRSYHKSDIKPNVNDLTSYWYSPIENKLRETVDTGATWTEIFGAESFTMEFSSGIITLLTPKTAFRAVDYNDAIVKSDWIEVQSVPVDPDPDKFYYTVES